MRDAEKQSGVFRKTLSFVDAVTYDSRYCLVHFCEGKTESTCPSDITSKAEPANQG